jgi:hypothetical protein
MTDESGPPDDIRDIRPRMSRAEVALLRAFAAGKAQLVEYGSGGSTLLALRLARRVISVEADGGWIERLSTHPSIAEALATGTLRFLQVDIGPVGAWSKPLDPSTSARWPAYAAAPWRLLQAEGRLPQHPRGIWRHLGRAPPAAPGGWVVLVDGRFRVACALQAALWIGPGDVVLVHDFWSRKPYHVLLDYLLPIARAGTMVALSPRPDVKRRAITSALTQYASDLR